jgi:hypothetical protein
VAIFDLFSKRQKKLRGEMPDVYQYDEIPQTLRVQIVHIWMDTLGNAENYWKGKAHEAYEFIVNTLCKEYGVFKLPGAEKFGNRDYLNELANTFLQEKNIDRCLDAIELSFKIVDGFTRSYEYLHRSGASKKADEAIDELNSRFNEHGVGYQFTDGEIIRVDSELIHSEIIKPALRLLNQKHYSGAHEEFLKAHEHYRHGNNKESLNECLKAFESVMKGICDKRKWAYQSGATSKTLIQICLDNGLIPSFWQQQYSSLRSLLESSVPTGRNKLSGHGQGADPISVPSYLVAYMLHMTAASIVFLAEAEVNLP